MLAISVWSVIRSDMPPSLPLSLFLSLSLCLSLSLSLAMSLSLSFLSVLLFLFSKCLSFVPLALFVNLFLSLFRRHLISSSQFSRSFWIVSLYLSSSLSFFRPLLYHYLFFLSKVWAWHVVQITGGWWGLSTSFMLENKPTETIYFWPGQRAKHVLWHGFCGLWASSLLVAILELFFTLDLSALL